MSKDDWKQLTTAVTTGGTKIVPVRLFEAENEGAPVIVMLAALGVPGGFYRRLAEQVCQSGATFVIVEQRGHGKSPYRPGDGTQFDLKAYLEEDIAAVMTFVKQTFPSSSVYVAGHSLGGHMAGLAAASRSEEIKGIIQIACGFPHYRFFGLRSNLMVRFLCLILPLITRVMGYFPGEALGFGGREYSGVMRDWRVWATTGCYDGVALEQAEVQLSRFQGGVLSIAIDRDDFASDKAVEYSYSRFSSAEVEVVKLTSEEQGDNLGHFSWAKAPRGVAHALQAWMQRRGELP